MASRHKALHIVFYNMSFPWLLPPDGFQFIFLLRDSENDLCPLAKFSAKNIFFFGVNLFYTCLGISRFILTPHPPAGKTATTSKHMSSKTSSTRSSPEAAIFGYLKLLIRSPRPKVGVTRAWLLDWFNTGSDRG